MGKLISQIPTGNIVEITINGKGFLKQYFSNVVNVRRDTTEICINPINISKEDMEGNTNYIATVISDRYYKFRIDDIRTENVDGKEVLVISSKRDCENINRRNSFRISCEVQSILAESVSREMLVGHILDISVTGMAIEIADKTDISDGMIVNVTFSGTDEFSNTKYSVFGKVVRIENEGNANNAKLGIAYAEENPELNKYIMYLQRQAIKRSRK